jgi:NADH-quinone oxidoreductase subunit M
MSDLLSIVTFLPLLGAIIILFLPKEGKNAIRSVAFAITALDFLVSLSLFFNFRSPTAAMQFVVRHEWIPSLGISYHLGIDGISLFLVLLTTFLTPLCVLGSWKSIQERVKEYMFFMLFLEVGMLGVFVSLDLFLFYVFWEVMLVPMYFLIGMWGGPRRIYAAVKFFLFTMFGSVLMLVAILYVYFNVTDPATGKHTFDLMIVMSQINFPLNVQMWLFGAFALAFAIKVPMFPFHTWLPDAHVEAPTAGSVILAGVLLKMGTYGFLRFCLPLFPKATIEYIPVISVLAIIGIIYGALVSLVQKDMKRLVAFSSVSHLGFVMLGLFALNINGVSGGLIQMINHGLSTGALFFIVGVVYDRRHTRMIADYGGLAKIMPFYFTVFMIVTLSSIGLPGLNGFVGEFLILVGTFQSNITYAVLAASGIILAACYMLWMFQRVMFGKITHKENEKLPDLSLREKFVFAPILVMIVWIGVYPSTFLKRMEPSVSHVVEIVKSAGSTKYATSTPSIECPQWADSYRIIAPEDRIW